MLIFDCGPCYVGGSLLDVTRKLIMTISGNQLMTRAQCRSLTRPILFYFRISFLTDIVGPLGDQKFMPPVDPQL